MRNLPENATYEQILGFWGEIVALRRIRSLGLPATHHGDFFGLWDINVGGIKVEIKTATATRTQSDRYRMFFRTSAVRNADFVILVGLSDEQFHFWVIPADEINVSAIAITSSPDRYNGQWAQYYEAWEQLVVIHRLKSLFKLN